MKKVLVLFVGMLISSVMMAQTEFKDLSFKQACELAKKENKMVFVDFTMDGCGPCKIMKQNVFPNQELGKLLNDNFISVTLNISSNAKDRALAINAGASAYPFYGFYNAESQELQHMATSLVSIEKMIRFVNNALSKDRSGAALWDKYYEECKDLDFLVKFAWHTRFECRNKDIHAEMIKMLNENYSDEQITEANDKL